MTIPNPIVSLIVPVLGDYIYVSPAVSQLYHDLLKQYPSVSNHLEIVMVVNGKQWLQAAALDGLRLDGMRVVLVDEEVAFPATLINRGVLAAKGRYLGFLWPGVSVGGWVNNLEPLLAGLRANPEACFVAGKPAQRNERSDPLHSWLRSPTDGVPPGFPGGWLEMLDYVPMECALVDRVHFIDQGGFSTSALLQRGFWWEFSIRIARSETIVTVETLPPSTTWTWYDYPLTNDLSLSGDVIARRSVRRAMTNIHVAEEDDWADADQFGIDLSEQDRKRLMRKLAPWRPQQTEISAASSTARPTGQNAELPTRQPLSVVVLGGLNEPAHNQLCFYNYFALLEGKGKLTWRAILDTAATPLDLTHADLVIFSRIKSPQGRSLMDFCVEHRIPTMYMLDDNWFWVGKDWPEYATIFAPGRPLYEDFLYCLLRANTVLTYNQVMADDLAPFSRRLEVLPTNIDLSLFPKLGRPVKRRPRVGYVGSLRKEDSAFIALAELARERDDFDVFVMSAVVPDTLSSLPVDRLVFQPYVFGYRRYARVLCEAMPDILLAPLGNNRTEASKCPNKYLEITAAEAVGIYSDTTPYSDFIRNGMNGLLVQNTASEWKTAMETLLDNISLRHELLQNASKDVYQNFRTESVLSVFCRTLEMAAAPQKSVVTS